MSYNLKTPQQILYCYLEKVLEVLSDDVYPRAGYVVPGATEIFSCIVFSDYLKRSILTQASG